MDGDCLKVVRGLALRVEGVLLMMPLGVAISRLLQVSMVAPLVLAK